MSLQWISKQNELERLIEELQETQWIVIDTEADSFHHFHEKLCLIQILTSQGVRLVDPLSPLKLNEFWKVLAEKKWKIHASDYDLRMIRKTGGGIPHEIFDTFLAGQILGKKALSYSALVFEYTGKTLSKSHQKADWTLRPLRESMREYAAADVLYVDAVVDALRKELEEKGRMDWLRQSCERQLRLVQKAEDPPDPAAWQISGHSLLNPQSRALLKELWQWRQNEAQERDLAPFRVLRNDLLHELILNYEKNLNPQKEFTIPHYIRGKSRALFEDHLEAGKRSQPIPFTPPPRPPAIAYEVDQRVAMLREKRQKIADALQIDPGVLASKAILLELAEKGAEAAQALLEQDRICHWQWELLAPCF